MDLIKTRWNRVDLIELAQDREKWRTVVKKAMKLGDLNIMQFPLKISFAVTAEE